MPSVLSSSVILSLGVGLLSGCASGRSAARAPSVSSAQRPAAHADTARPREAPPNLRAPFLERESYVRAVLAANPSIEAARQGWRGALARVEQAGSFEGPMVELAMAPLSIGSSMRFGYEVGVTQQLPWFGKRGFERDVAAAEAEAAKCDFEATRRSLAVAAISLYGQYYVIARSLEVNAHHLALMRELKAAATAQFEAGRASAQDPLRAEVELAHMEHDTAVLAAERDVVVAQMNELLHRDPDSPLPPPPRDLPLRATPSAQAPRLESEAIEHRPEIAGARQRILAEQARARRAERESYPDIMLSTSYSSMWEMPEHRWMVGVGFALPIDFQRRAGAIDEAKAMQAQLQSEVAQMTDMAKSEVFVAMRRLRESEHVLGMFEQRVLPLARDQIEAARTGFVTSQDPFMAVVEAERNQRSVELDYHTIRAEYDRRRAELDRALGRIPGLDREEQQP